jgi:positive regulator of sigma E activity
MNRDLAAATTGTATHDMSHSLAGKLWWLLPAAAALFYPLALKTLYESGKLLHRASGPAEAVAWLSIVASAALVYSVPAVGIGVAYLLGRHERTSSSELLARRIAHLAVASPPLFVLIGVVFYLLHSANGDSMFWSILWLIVFAAAAWSMRRQSTETSASSTPNPIPLRFAHGTSALLIVLIFLAWHLLNHASAAFSREFNQEMMNSLRKWYRSEVIQPVLVTLMLFQVVSGLTLFWRATATRSDLYRTLQTSTGAFLTAFFVSHLNAVFILGRAVTKVDTTFLWASGAPVGLLPDAWNVRLIPHYSLGVWFVITHMGLGLRGVLLFHRVSLARADRVAWAAGAVGTALAVTITIAQLGVHGAS